MTCHVSVPSTVAHDLTEKSEKVEDGEAAPEVTCEASICSLHLCVICYSYLNVVDMVSKPFSEGPDTYSHQ